jgi:uncharacterized membrane protein YdbT with pleckstrin-like domain
VLRAIEIRRVENLVYEDGVVFRPFPAVVARVGSGGEEGETVQEE